MDRRFDILRRYRNISEAQVPAAVLQASKDYWARVKQECDRLQEEYHSRLDSVLERVENPVKDQASIEGSVDDIAKKIDAIDAADPAQKWLDKRQSVLLRILERFERNTEASENH